jgi:hypothetical protein
VVRRTSASCNLTVGSWECRQAATGRERPSHPLTLRRQVSVNFGRSREEQRSWLSALAAWWAPQVVFCLTCSQTLEITTEPSPTAEATRFTDPARTSPTAKMPG